MIRSSRLEIIQSTGWNGSWQVSKAGKNLTRRTVRGPPEKSSFGVVASNAVQLNSCGPSWPSRCSPCYNLACCATLGLSVTSRFALIGLFRRMSPDQQRRGGRMFSGKVLIVTGAAGNVGSALATLLASRGARIAAVDTLRDRLEAVVAGLSGSGHLALADHDLTDSDAANSLVAKVRQTCGRLDGVGTTVGGFAMAKLANAGLEQWDAMFSLNVKTTWNMYRAAVPAIRAAGGGALVGIGSAAGLRGSGEMAAYSATKSAVMRLTESLADELR